MIWNKQKGAGDLAKIKCEIYRDSFQNFRRYAIPKAQLVIADIPFNIGNNFYGSRRSWWVDDDTSKPSKDAGKAAFYSDYNFNLYEYFNFCSKMLKKEPKKAGERGRSSEAPCMIVFCSFEQIGTLIQAAKKHGFIHYIPLIFCKNYSPQVLKANMRVVGAVEYALLFYRDKLPKFRNEGKMIFNWFDGGNEQEWGKSFYFLWDRDKKGVPKIHPTQKPVSVLKRLIEIFTDEGDVVIDPCCGSGSTLRAAKELNRNSFGFEISKEFYDKAVNEMLNDNYIDSTGQIQGQESLFDFLEV